MSRVLLSLILAGLALQPTIAAPRSPGTAGGHGARDSRNWSRALIVAGETRTYRVHLPPFYNGRRAMPLVIALHARGGKGSNFEWYSAFSTKADHEGFIVAYPDALGKPTSWRPGYDPDPRGVSDIPFLRLLIDTLEKALAIDRRRVFVVGHSSGAMMACDAGAELSDRVAAIGIVSGWSGMQLRNGKTFSIPAPRQPVSVIAIHGMLDINVPYYGGGKPADRRRFLSVNDMVQFWVRQDGCQPQPARIFLKAGNVVQQVYTGGRAGSEVLLYTRIAGAHSWPGAREKPKKRTWKDRLVPRLDLDITATNRIWEFFARHGRVVPPALVPQPSAP